MSNSKHDDFFSIEKRIDRKRAKIARFSNVHNALIKDATSGQITTQNVGVKAVELVRDIINNYRIPNTPKLSYSGMRNGRTAANSSKVDSGVVTIHASLRTASNIGISFDIPIEVRDGKLLDPSVLVYNGTARVIAQSTFDDIVSASTINDIVSVRDMYASPLSHQDAQSSYSNRITMPRNTGGMFSVSAAQNELRKAVRGQAVDLSMIAANTNQPKPPKPPKLPSSIAKPPKPPSPLKSNPQLGRLCSKCNHAPCVCPNKRKKKSFNEEALVHEAIGRGWNPAFFNKNTKEVIITPGFHDTSALPNEEFTSEWVDGFVNKDGKFYDRFETYMMEGFNDSHQIRSSKFVYRAIVASDSDLVSKVAKEAQDMMNDGISDIDCKMAIRNKYGDDMVVAVFNKIGPTK